MKTIIYSIRDFERPWLLDANKRGHELTLTTEALNAETARLAEGHEAVVVFTADDLSAPVIAELHHLGLRYIAIRAAGYDNIALDSIKTLGMRCANVPAYSPFAVAEHAAALILALNRKLILADRQVHAYNFTVDQLLGFDLHQKTVGIIGTGRIGSVMARIMNGFGCRLLGYDPVPDNTLVSKYQMQYTDLQTICRQADIITLHSPLNSATHHLIGKDLIAMMKPGMMLINTARGSIIDTAAVLAALDNGTIGALGIDVYEHEKGLFFYDRSATPPDDPMLARLLDLPNVIVTPHQGFATEEALHNIADTTFYNLNTWAEGQHSANEII